jgi:hypothetical protein
VFTWVEKAQPLQSAYESLMALLVEELHSCTAEHILQLELVEVGALWQFMLLDRLGTQRASMTDLCEGGAWQSLMHNENGSLVTLLSSGNIAMSYQEDMESLASEWWEKAVRIFCLIWEHDSSAHHDSVRLRLAVAVALTWACGGPVRLRSSFWYQYTFTPEGCSAGIVDPLARYDECCSNFDNRKYLDRFQYLTAWQLRYVVSSEHSQEEAEWVRNACPNGADEISYNWIVEYTSERHGNSIQGWDFYEGRPVTLELIAEYGAVCGGISVFRTGVCQSFGVPAIRVGQPGHCAFIWQKQQGEWELGNDVSGWTSATPVSNAGSGTPSMALPFGTVRARPGRLSALSVP